MPRRRLIRKVLPIYGAAIVLCTLGVAWYAGSSANNLVRTSTQQTLEDAAWVFALQLGRDITESRSAQIHAACDALRQKTGARFTVIAADGSVLGDSHADPAQMDNHAGRPEVVEALAGRVGLSTRRSNTLRERATNVAVPVTHGGQLVGVARVSQFEHEVEAAVGRVAWRVIVGGLLAAVALGLLTFWVFQRYIAQPLADLRTGAARLAQGQLDQAVRVPDTMEIGALAESLNAMGRRVSEQIGTITEQASEREAVLSSMTEGVIAVDPAQMVIAMNRAAASLLDVDEVRAVGRPIAELVRNANLLRLIGNALRAQGHVEGEVTLSTGRTSLHLAGSATPLRDAEGKRIGAVVVLNDITRLRELETIRQHFVANVSHELKTPITAIKAAVETVMSDADDPEEAAQTSRRFLPVVARQADRLNAIVEDLLTLARLEQSAADETVPMASVRILPVLKEAIETCQPLAQARNTQIEIDCDAALAARANDTLLCQAVVNLLDNAIKYSPPGKRVLLAGHANGSSLVIRVQDEGPGIEPQHLPRLFERFYRTDKARSRDMGGTGLGLAIVKHVAQVHGGRATVTSKVDAGSTFELHLSKAPGNEHNGPKPG